MCLISPRRVAIVVPTLPTHVEVESGCGKRSPVGVNLCTIRVIVGVPLSNPHLLYITGENIFHFNLCNPGSEVQV